MSGAVTVTQADRDAAAAYYYSAGGSPNIAREIRAGEKDTWFRVQAFARHRHAAEAASKQQIAELVQALGWFVEPNSTHPHHVAARAILARAHRAAMSPERRALLDAEWNTELKEGRHG